MGFFKKVFNNISSVIGNEEDAKKHLANAKRYMREGDWLRSRAELYTGMPIASPIRSDFTLNLGVCDYMLNLKGRAEIYFKSAVESRPDHARYHAALADYYERTSEYDNALVAYRDWARLGVDSFAAQAGLGWMCLTEHLPDEAIPAFEKAAALDPNHTSPKVGLGGAYLQKQDQTRGLQYLGEAIKSHPQDAETFHLAGHAFLLAGDFAKSQQTLERALSINPNHEKALIDLATLSMQNQRHSDTVGYAKRALKIDPHNVNAAILHGMANYQSQNWLEATYALEDAVLSACLGSQKTWQNISDKMWFQFIKIHPDAVELLRMLGLAYIQCGKVFMALNVTAELEYLGQHILTGKDAAAIPNAIQEVVAAGKQFMADHPDSPATYYFQGVSLRGKEKLGLLLKLADGPNPYPDALHDLGLLLSQANKTTEAIKKYEEVLALEPGHAHARYDLSIDLYDPQNPSAAIQQNEILLEQRPLFYSAQRRRGLWHLADNDPNKALPFLLESLKTVPHDGESYFWLSLSYIDQGMEYKEPAMELLVTSGELGFEPAQVMYKKFVSKKDHQEISAAVQQAIQDYMNKVSVRV
jgi:tetratricopeptide (TPR) repeat protein